MAISIEKKTISFDDIKPNKENPRIIKKDKYKKLVQSLIDFPEMLDIRELVLDENMMILGGNMRYRALKEIEGKSTSDKILEVPVKIISGLTEEQKKEFIIKDNAGFGEWDYDVLANEWSDFPLANWGVDMKGFGEEKIEGEEDFTEEILEEHNYVIFYFDDAITWNMVKQRLGLKAVKALDSKEGYQRVGVGRVVHGSKLIELIEDKKNV